MEGFETYQLLVEEIGEEGAKKVFKLFSGDSVRFPKKVNTILRDLEIIKRFESGESYRNLARAYNLSTQRIRNLTSLAHQKDMIKKLAELSQSQNF